jgi:hypothetical protein
VSEERGEHERFERWREHVWLTALFLLTRVVLQASGLRFNFELNWMFMCDPGDLRSRAFDCVYYFHAYPPGMNALGSLFLKLGGSHAATLALVVFWSLGALLVNSLFYLLRVSGLSLAPAFAVATAFSLIPQTLYFEHLYLYEHIVAAMLTAACAFLHYAVERSSARAMAACFWLCAIIGWFRSTFHLVWFPAVVVLALLFVNRRHVRSVLLRAVAPFALLLALYVKNAGLFGVFGASSAMGANLSLVTIDRLDPHVRDRWLAEHEISPFAGMSVFAGPADYLPFFPAHSDGRSPILDAVERPTFHSGNFNHWVMLLVMRARERDATFYLRKRPLEYAVTAMQNVKDFFGPATRWHPRTGKPGSPHYEHAKVLGAYENAYNGLVHWGWGMYVLLPVPCFWAGKLVRDARAATPVRRARAAVFAFSLLQIFYVTSVSVLFSAVESARYRHQIEALLWLLSAGCISSIVRHRRLRTRRA